MTCTVCEAAVEAGRPVRPAMNDGSAHSAVRMQCMNSACSDPAVARQQMRDESNAMSQLQRPQLALTHSMSQQLHDLHVDERGEGVICPERGVLHSQPALPR